MSKFCQSETLPISFNQKKSRKNVFKQNKNLIYLKKNVFTF